jgi:hypothetical protein
MFPVEVSHFDSTQSLFGRNIMDNFKLKFVVLPIDMLHKRATAGMTPDEAPATFFRCKSAGPCLHI